MTAEQEPTPHREVVLRDFGGPLEEVRCQCGAPLTMFCGVDTQEVEVSLRCESCRVDYVVRVRTE